MLVDKINSVYWGSNNSGDFGLTKHDCSFIEFKKKVTCFRVKKLVFDKWKELNTI